MSGIPDNLKAVHNEMVAIADLYSRLSKQCFEKCIDKFHDGELSIGENTCIDRCCHKYMETQKKIGEILSKESDQQS